MADLAKRGFRSISLGQLSDGQERTVLITFDDGYAHVAQTVTPILARHGFSAAMFIPAAYVGRRNTWDTDEHPNLAALTIVSPEQVRSMAAGPWEIASHGFRHADLRDIESTARMKELVKARVQLSEMAGRPVTALAYPYGHVDPAVEKAALLADYNMAFVAGPGVRGNAFRLSRYPVRGTDDIGIFRLATSGWLGRLQPVQRIAPAWARAAVRAAINASGRAQ